MLLDRTDIGKDRARRERSELARSSSVTEAIYDSGYNSNARFYEKASDVLGMTPRAYRAGGAAASIRFAVGECSLGSILVAKSERGVCAILLGDDPDVREWAMHMMLVARCLERIGDNAVDIGEQVAFVVTGLFREFEDASHPA